MYLTNRDKLLSSVMPVFAGFESLTADLAVDDVGSIAAQEALGSKIKELAAAWFAKAWAAAKAAFDKVGHFVEKIGQSATNAATYIKDKTFDAARAAKTFIKAHPIASAFIALAAIAAIGVVVAALYGVPLPVTAAGMTAWKSKINTIINTGLGKFGIKIDDAGSLSQEAIFEKHYATFTNLGYSDTEARKLIDAAAKVASGETVTGATRKAAEHAARLLKDAADTAAENGAGYASKRAALNHLLGITGMLCGHFLRMYGGLIAVILIIAARIYIAKKTGS